MRITPISRCALSALISCSALTTTAPLLHAQDFLIPGNQFEGKNITSVVIKYRSAKTVSDAAIRAYMSTSEGKKYSQAMLDEDVRSLYQSGLVDDVTFFAENDGDGVKVIAEVVTRPSINGVGFEGNTIFSDRKLADATGLEAGQTLSDTQVLAARKKIEEHYQGYGYPNVTVTHGLQKTDREGFADLVFLVEEGAKSEVRNINFQGNQAFADVVLRREMDTKEKGLFSFITKSGRIDNVRLDEDLEKIADYYRSEGYWRVKVGIPQQVPVKDGRVDLVIPVEEGHKYLVNAIGFGKMSVFRPEELTPALSLVGNMAYSSKKVRDDIRAIRSYYGSRGYADATVSPDVREVGTDKVDIYYRITEGRRYKVGRVNIQGNTKSKDNVIRREVPMIPGENFNSVDMETTKKRLENLRYFEDRGGVQVSSSNSAQEGYRDVNILVNEKKTGSINFGLGFSSIDNIVGFVNLEQTNFDITNFGSFTGGGQRFSASLRGGSERKDLRVSLVEPWFMGRKLSLGTELYYRDLLFLSDQYDQTQVGASVFLRQPLGRKSYVKGEYRIENIEIDVESDTPADSLFQAEEGDYTRSAVTFSYVYDSRDSNQQPRKGEKIDVDLTLAGGPFAGDVDLYNVSVNGQKHWNLKWDSILTLRGAASVVDGYSDDDFVPIFDRQFLGGSRDLRGFEYRDIGPRDPITNDVLGGGTSAFLTLEYTFPIVETVRGAVFYDVGFVNEESWDFGADDVASDIGIGARLNLPIGPLAIDYAIPVSSPDDEADQGGQFNFYLNYQY